MYADVVLGVEHRPLRGDRSRRTRSSTGYTLDTELNGRRLEVASSADYKDAGARSDRQALPAGSARAALGRDRRGVRVAGRTSARSPTAACTTSPTSWGTAVNVQAMVFGNMGDDCATGVAFTRNPSTGENEFYGEFLVNAQGEDVVAGIRTPQHHRPKASARGVRRAGRWKKRCPRRSSELTRRPRAAREALPRHAGHRVHRSSSGKLCMLQTRNGKRTAQGRAADRRRHGERGADHQEGGGAARRARPRSTSCCIRRSIPSAKRKVIAHGPAGLAGRRRRARSCSPPTRPRAAGRAGEQGHPGARRDQPGGHPRHARRGGHPDRARRHDRARGGGRARHGQALRRRLRRRSASTYGRGTMTRRRAHVVQDGRRHHASTAAPARCMRGRDADRSQPELSRRLRAR